MKCLSYIDCYTCGDRIREFADDIVLKRRDETEIRLYHVGCSPEAERVYLADPAAWRLGYRQAFADDDVADDVEGAA